LRSIPKRVAGEQRHLLDEGYFIIGPNIAIDEVAQWAGTISYELLTRLGQRYARLYSGLESTISGHRSQ
jgi:alanine racemase